MITLFERKRWEMFNQIRILSSKSLMLFLKLVLIFSQPLYFQNHVTNFQLCISFKSYICKSAFVYIYQYLSIPIFRNKSHMVLFCITFSRKYKRTIKVSWGQQKLDLAKGVLICEIFIQRKELDNQTFEKVSLVDVS